MRLWLWLWFWVESQVKENVFGWTASWRFDGGQRKYGYKSNPTENGWLRVAGGQGDSRHGKGQN